MPYSDTGGIFIDHEERLLQIYDMMRDTEQMNDEQMFEALEELADETKYSIRLRDQHEHDFKAERLESLTSEDWRKINNDQDWHCHIISYIRRLTYGDHSQASVFTVEDKLIMKKKLCPQRINEPCDVKQNKRKI